MARSDRNCKSGSRMRSPLWIKGPLLLILPPRPKSFSSLPLRRRASLSSCANLEEVAYRYFFLSLPLHEYEVAVVFVSEARAQGLEALAASIAAVEFKPRNRRAFVRPDVSRAGEASNGLHARLALTAESCTSCTHCTAEDDALMSPGRQQANTCLLQRW